MLRSSSMGQHGLAMFGNLFFTTVVVVVLIFTIIAAIYDSEQPESTSTLAVESDETTVKICEDLLSANQIALTTFISITKAADDHELTNSEGNECEGDVSRPIDCRDPEVFHSMISVAIQKFTDIHFNRFGKPIHGPQNNTCDMAWWFRPKGGKSGKNAKPNKDFRRFVVLKFANCSLRVINVGEYHSGLNARKPKLKVMMDNTKGENETISIVRKSVNDTLPIVESEESFKNGRYLYYSGGGDRCKSMNHYVWSFLCALGEAQYLERTLVMDMHICLASMYTNSGKNEEGKDFRFYFDFQHLKESASVLDQAQFWKDWTKWHMRNGLSLYLVEDFRVSPVKLRHQNETLIIRKFGDVEPDSYWYRVCDADADTYIQRPWHMLKKSIRLMDIVSTIVTKMNGDYDSIHVIRGTKASNKRLWPNLDRDTSTDRLISTLKDNVTGGRNLYIATNEGNKSIFEALKDKYRTHFLDDYKVLWQEQSNWYSDTSKLNNKAPVEFDGYMKLTIDAEVFLRGKLQLETFNDLTKDCKEGVNNCYNNSSAW